MPRPILEVTPGHLERAFRFNVATAHALVRAGVPIMLDGGGGAIVNISSFAASVGARGMVAYATAKAALSHYTDSAAAELGPRIRVNAIEVGTVATRCSRHGDPRRRGPRAHREHDRFETCRAARGDRCGRGLPGGAIRLLCHRHGSPRGRRGSGLPARPRPARSLIAASSSAECRPLVSGRPS